MSAARSNRGLGIALERYTSALWGGRFEVGCAQADAARSAFDGRSLLLPGLRDDPTNAERDLAYARAAHAAAHTAFSGPPQAVGSLKPLQQVLVALFEDARVEALAMKRFPGLRRLWAPFHELRTPPSRLAPLGVMLARLSRALFDAAYADPDSWIQKARDAFRALELEASGPQHARQLGNLLGNDLGQMRLPFDAGQYAVEPVYRDDHSGLWQHPPLPAKSVSPRPAQAPGSAPEASSITTHTYSEWDYVIARARPTFCEVNEQQLSRSVTSLSANQVPAAIARRIHQILRRALRQPSRDQRESEGPVLDLAAAVDAAAERRAGGPGAPSVYRRPTRRSKPRSALLLLDLSESSNAPLGDGSPAIDLVRACARLLCASSLPGLELAIDGFSSYGRRDVRYRCFKQFAEPPRAGLERLAQLSAAGSTRLGAALRHASARLKSRAPADKLLLVVTDADPADVDVYDARYLIEDARVAVEAARRAGVSVFACSFPGGDPVVQRLIFGRQLAPLARLEDLPQRLQAAFSARSRAAQLTSRGVSNRYHEPEGTSWKR
jgi:nitric oxide reductase NorD protein